MTVDEILDEIEAINKQWIEWCMNCKHAYKEEIENEVDNPFDYLEDLAKQEKENENS